ncbi:MAG: acyl phosphate:glycerol-3-phosphate acyltransferase [Fimbriimonadaceae bacterium]|nr:acyl phosphate:glycerol-3-phosphate acyltransferase [Fimbriimonadaceae bacterium]
MNAQSVLLFLGSYILGAIPFGFLIARARGIDITKIGSGNIGATNVHRALGWKAGIPVLLLDVLKGLAPPLVAKALGFSVDIAFLAGIAAVLGHCFSPFLKFKGGKGIATMLGAAWGATPLVAAGAMVAFAIVFAITRYVSLASILAAVAAIVLAFFFHDEILIPLGYGLVWLFIMVKHKSNIRRLLNGEEPKTSLKGGEKREEAERLARQDAKKAESEVGKDEE